MMELIIAEKPSVARDLARVLGARPSGKGAYEGSGRVITWCVGHLVELEEPAAYDGRWKAWRLDTLPMLPAEFKLRPARHAADQLRTVTALLRDRRFTSVVNACDAGREGELIFRYLLQYAGRTPPTARRLWISSLTDEAIRRGLASLRPAAQFDALGDAARARSEADWLVGMNATRAVTVRLRGSGGDVLYSIGRVQTPTLAMLVAREQAIRAFVARDYWEVEGTFSRGDDARFSARWTRGTATRLGSAGLADAIVGRAGEHGAAGDAHGPRVARVQEKSVREPPPYLFDLTSLQRTANRRFGMSAQHTLDVAQALYERHKLLTYPRTDSRHLTSDVAKELPSLWAALAALPEYAAYAQPLVARPPRPSRRVVDDARVGDHHAIIPTGKAPVLDRLDADERRLFDLVVRRFVGAFYPDAEFAITEVLVRVGPGSDALPPPSPSRPAAAPAPGEDDAADETPLLAELPPPPDWFVARGRVRVAAGWQAVAGFGDGEPGGGGEAPATLPPLKTGQPLDGTFAAQAKQTQPPRRFSEAALLAAMESAGKALTDDELRAAMKDTGLGTPATRANIIETLLKRDYARRERKLIVPTPTGMALIAALPVASLASPELTGAWEARLARIARGEEARERFMADIADYVRQTVAAVAALPAAAVAEAAIDTPPVGRCPRCGGAVRSGRRAFACSGDGCGFAMPTRVAGRAISPKLAAVLLARRRSEVLRGFRSKAKKPFSAALRLEEDGKLTFDFGDGAHPRRSESEPRPARAAKPMKAPKPAKAPKRPRAAPVAIGELPCPRCQQAHLVAGKRGWGCARWREGCGFVVWFETAGRTLTPAQLRDLVVRGQTRRARFRPDGGGDTEGRLVLDRDGAGGARFSED